LDARIGRNNQDPWATWIDDDFTVLVVADGCSGGVASEFGAHFSARWVVAQAARPRHIAKASWPSECPRSKAQEAARLRLNRGVALAKAVSQYQCFISIWTCPPRRESVSLRCHR
jgi:hypothetical protein